MIILTKLGGKPILLNEANIEAAYETPDTVILMNNGHTYIVTESIEQIREKAVDFNRRGKRHLRPQTESKAENS